MSLVIETSKGSSAMPAPVEPAPAKADPKTESMCDKIPVVKPHSPRNLKIQPARQPGSDPDSLGNNRKKQTEPKRSSSQPKFSIAGAFSKPPQDKGKAGDDEKEMARLREESGT